MKKICYFLSFMLLLAGEVAFGASYDIVSMIKSAKNASDIDLDKLKSVDFSEISSYDVVDIYIKLVALDKSDVAGGILKDFINKKGYSRHYSKIYGKEKCTEEINTLILNSFEEYLDNISQDSEKKDAIDIFLTLLDYGEISKESLLEALKLFNSQYQDAGVYGETFTVQYILNLLGDMPNSAAALLSKSGSYEQDEFFRNFAYSLGNLAGILSETNCENLQISGESKKSIVEALRETLDAVKKIPATEK